KGKKRELPLREKWEQWRQNRPKSLHDNDGLELLRAWIWSSINDWQWREWQLWKKATPDHRRILKALSGNSEQSKLRYLSIVPQVLEWLIYLDPPVNLLAYLLDAVETAFSMVPKEFNQKLIELASSQEKYNPYEPNCPVNSDWREGQPIRHWI